MSGRKKEEGRRKKEEGRRKKEEGARRDPNLFVLWQLGVRPEAGG